MFAKSNESTFGPTFRGNRLGDHMLNRLLSDARSFGYKIVLLDSGPFMTSAHKVYERCGFQERAPYQEAEVPSDFHSGGDSCGEISSFCTTCSISAIYISYVHGVQNRFAYRNRLSLNARTMGAR